MGGAVYASRRGQPKRVKTAASFGESEQHGHNLLRLSLELNGLRKRSHFDKIQRRKITKCEEKMEGSCECHKNQLY